MVVGLRLNAGLLAKEGDPLYGQEEEEEEGVAPCAAALSDALLVSNCAACFGACAPARFACHGPCQGTIAYCSLSCRDLDMPLHIHSGECSLLCLLQSPSRLSLDESPLRQRSSFPSLGGTCDLRTALRLLTHHEALHHIAPFLAASSSQLECARLGGLLSNRSMLLQPTPSVVVDKTSEMEEEELLIATELREAALLMRQARFSTSMEARMNSPSKHIEGVDYVPGTHTDVCMADSGHAQGHVDAHMDVCMLTTGHIGSKHLDNIVSTHGNVHTHEDVCMVPRETRDGSIDTQKDLCIETSGHLNMHKAADANVPASSMESLTLAEQLLLVEEVICQVFTNGVRIQVDTWFSDGHSYVGMEDLGTAVYGPLLSWINHSCRPNAFYSFVLAGPTNPRGTLKVPLVPDTDTKGLEDAWGLKTCCVPWFEEGNRQGMRHYGPRACLRSIGKINGLEPVCISYVDLLQPKDTRRQELWMKYRFHCLCERCDMESANNVDTILQNIGISEGWLLEEAQCGLSEFLNNDNPLSCCQILEDALIRVLHEMHQNRIQGGALPEYVSSEASFNHSGGISFGGQNLRSEVSERHGSQLNLHLMHRLCLDIYMTLSSSYKVLATGFDSSRFESSSMLKDIEERRAVECSVASAAYTLILAATMQYMYDFGEPGLLCIAAHSWLQVGEALINLIVKLDGYLFISNTLEMPKFFSKLSGDHSEAMVSFCEEEFLGEMKKVLSAHGRLSEAIYRCASTVDLLRCMIILMWPVLRNASLFLSHIETPFDMSKVFLGSSRIQTCILGSKDIWMCYRAEAVVAMLCALQQGLKLMNVCYGISEKRILAVRDFLSSHFHKTSTSQLV